MEPSLRTTERWSGVQRRLYSSFGFASKCFIPGDDQLHLPQKLFVVGPVRKAAESIYKRTIADIRQGRE